VSVASAKGAGSANKRKECVFRALLYSEETSSFLRELLKGETFFQSRHAVQEELRSLDLDVREEVLNGTTNVRCYLEMSRIPDVKPDREPKLMAIERSAVIGHRQWAQSKLPFMSRHRFPPRERVCQIDLELST